MGEREKLLVMVGVLAGGVMLLGVLAWNLVAAFRHECKPGSSGAQACMICGVTLQR